MSTWEWCESCQAIHGGQCEATCTCKGPRVADDCPLHWVDEDGPEIVYGGGGLGVWIGWPRKAIGMGRTR